MIKLLGKLEILYKWLFTNQPTSVALDVTHRCNLKCEHCYWWKQDHPKEMDDDEMISFMKNLKASGLRAALLYGGEPTLRPDICKAAGEIFDTTLAFTNGTNGFPYLENGQWILSLDGTRDVNDSIRGDGVYDLAIKNLLTASRPPIVHITLSKLNRDNLEAFVSEILKLPVKGIGFSFYTPNIGIDESEYFLSLAERSRLAKQIVSLRKRYGERVGFTSAMVHQLEINGGFLKWNSLSSCPVSKRVRCFGSDGRNRACTYGEDADCSRCGCAAVAVYRGAFRSFDYQSFRLILGLMLPQAEVGKGTVETILEILGQRKR